MAPVGEPAPSEKFLVGYSYAYAAFRLEEREKCEQELDSLKPTVVLNCAGLTGRPNVDWCETHRQEVIRANVLGMLNLIDCCFSRNIHVTNFGTGCIYHYDEGEHRYVSEGGRPFKEEDPANFFGSFYSRTKAVAEQLALEYPNVLNLRLRMPISDDLSARNFIVKLTKYSRVVNIPNSVTVLHELLPVAISMSHRRLTGKYNFTNPGSISHNEVLKLYREYIDPNFQWKNFSLEEQAKILKAGRSNCELDVSKLLRDNPDAAVNDAHTAVKLALLRTREKLDNHNSQ
ncbi:Trifunctional UDP-glucose 4,6-dehydratase/UDP-4-keto-6-deoxy-D-glucose 3,5-epimerase/UDP-4-keto-L-rhamnose-reductase RHM1 [Galdieria sulphuraria]|nr:Trifunctional UDP-glucose 4,6-dehydratase/UDP-4-keto-6-deoxy-D-glucose 3,5-epimerase/UDP-4-keto-L-rhamnose-reductase RHM1 [Galdieria sulphuraria]